MWVSEKCARKKKLKRSGLLNTLILPAGSGVSDKKYNIKINAKTKSIEFVSGKSVYAITDKIGVSELCEFSFFFLDDFMVIEVQKGCIYLESEKKGIVSLNSKNKISEYLNDTDIIDWKSKDTIWDFCSSIVKRKYNLESSTDIQNYISNLIFTVQSSYYLKENKLYTFKFEDYFFDLGIDIFKYEKKEKVEKSEFSKFEKDIKPLKDDIEEEYVDELERKVVKNSKVLSDLSDLDVSELDLDELDILPENMHEIDIFKDYSSETSETF